MYEFCDKETGKIVKGSEDGARDWIAKNYNDVEMMLKSMNEHPGDWYNGMFRDCRKVSK